jgi:Skp family chaperone for outer membrane proteins
MRASTSFVLGAVVAAAGLVTGGALAMQDPPPPPPAPAKPVAVAFVDVGLALQALKRSQALVDGVKADGEALRADLTRRAEELKKRITDINAGLNPGTPEHEAEMRKIDLESRGIEWDEKAGRDRIEKKKVRGLARLYREVVAEAERIADERGFAALLHVDGEPIYEEDDMGRVLGSNDLKMQMALRGVLWCRKDVNITGEVIAALNK